MSISLIIVSKSFYTICTVFVFCQHCMVGQSSVTFCHCIGCVYMYTALTPTNLCNETFVKTVAPLPRKGGNGSNFGAVVEPIVLSVSVFCFGVLLIPKVPINYNSISIFVFVTKPIMRGSYNATG